MKPGPGRIIAIVVALLLLVALMPKACAQVMLPHRHALLSSAVSTNPPYFGDLILWLSADSFNGVQADETAITNWPDLSSYGNHFIGAGVTNPPTYQSNQVAGYSAIHFNYTNYNYLYASNTAVQWWRAYTNGYHIFYVLRSDVLPVAGNGLDSFTDASSDFGTLLLDDNTNYASRFQSPVSNNGRHPIGSLFNWSFVECYSAVTNFGIWMNGLLQRTNLASSFGAQAADNTKVMIGRADPDQYRYYLNGWIAHVLMYKKVLSTPERTLVHNWLVNKYAIITNTLPAAAGAGPTNGLVGWWRFDEPIAESFAYDVDTTNNHTWDLSYNLSTSVQRAIGHNGAALEYDDLDNGGTTSVDTATFHDGDPAEYRFSTNFSIAMWLKSYNLAQTNAHLLNRATPQATNMFAIQFNYGNQGTSIYAAAYTGSNPATGATISISDTNWHHIVYSYDGSTWAGYKDGTNAFSVARTFALSSVPLTGWRLGGWMDTSPKLVAVFNGLFDELRFYNKGLSPAEVASLYAQ